MAENPKFKRGDFVQTKLHPSPTMQVLE